MNTVQRILHRSVTEPFYRQHAGLFLFAFFILFGIQPSAYHILQFHYSIILSILDSPGFFAVAFLIWAVYTLKVVLFIRSCLKKESYDFLYLLTGIPGFACLRQLAGIILVMLAPLWIYGLTILAVAIWKGSWLQGLLVVIVIILLTASAVTAAWILLNKGKDNQRMQRTSGLPLVRPGLFSILLQFVFRKQFITLLILKLISFSALYFFARTDSQVFENRMLWLLYITALAGHGAIIYRNLQFMENELFFFRNLPVSRWYILLSLLGVYALLLIPELWALKSVIFIQHNPLEYSWLLLLGPSFLLLIHCILYSEDLKMQDFLGLLFGIWLIFIFFSLSSMHWLMSVIALLFSVVLFRISYYSYEKTVDTEEPKIGQQ